MAQLPDEYTPERDSYQSRMRPTPVRRAAPSPTLPPWVQARLKEQAQTEARRKTAEAAQAKEAAAQARREAAAFDRLAAVNLRALVPKPAAKQSKTVSRAPKALPVAQFRSPTFDELAAPRVPVRPTPRPAPTAPVEGPPPRDTPEYYAYLKGVINGTTQGIAPGVGSFSDAGEPARRKESTQPRPFSLLSNQDDELAAARVPVRAAPPSAGSGSAAGVPPRGTPEYYAYLKEVINGTTQGIAPGVGSYSEAGEPARRDGARELTLAEMLADGFDPGGEATGRGKRFGKPEPPTASGSGARMFEVTPDEESYWAAISPDEFISEELIEIHKRGEFNDEDVAIMEEYSPEAGQRAELIAYYDDQGLRGKSDADALRAGAPVGDGTWGVGIPQPVEDAFYEGRRGLARAKDRGVRAVNDQIDQVGDVLDWVTEFGPTVELPQRVEELRTDLVQSGSIPFATEPELRGGQRMFGGRRGGEGSAFERLAVDLDSPAAMRERFRNAGVGFVTTPPDFWNDPALMRIFDGFMERQDFLGDENPIRDVLPEVLEDEGVFITEQLADPFTLAQIAAMFTPAGWVNLPIKARVAILLALERLDQASTVQPPD